MNLDVLIPSLLLPAPMHKLLPPPNIPALEQLLARADRRINATKAGASWLCDCWGIAAPYPIAPLLAEHDGIDVSNHAWLFAEPFHHSPQQQWRKLSPARFLELSSDESAELIAALNANFADRRLTFFAPTPARWYVRCDPMEIPATTPIDLAGIGSPLDYQPQSSGALNWRSIQNEAQMLLFAHPVNAAREATGRPLISGVWFWGGGTRPVIAKPAYQRVAASSPLAIQLARRAGIKVQPMTWDSVRSASGTVLAVADSCDALARDDDWLKWAQELERLDREWFLPLLDALGAGIVASLTIHAPLADAIQTFHLTRRQHSFRFWRASKSLSTYASHA